MSNTIKLKRGTSTPSVSDISNGEVAIDTQNKKLYINDSGTVKEIGGSGTIAGATGLDFNDNVKVRFGTGNDLEIYHDTANSRIVNGTAWLNHQSVIGYKWFNGDATETLIEANVDGTVELYYDGTKKFETTSTGSLFHTSLKGADNADIFLGNSDDLQIFHNGTQNIVGNTATQLRLITDALRFRSATGSETYAQANVNGAFEAHYDNVKKFETTSSGVDVTGNITTTGEIEITGSSTVLKFTESDDNPDFGFLGNAGSLRVQDLTNTANLFIFEENRVRSIKNFDAEAGIDVTGDITATGNLTISNTAPWIQFTDTNTNPDWLLQNSNGAFVFHDGTASRLQLSTSGNVEIPSDTGKLQLGASQDLQIYHDGSNSTLSNTTGYFHVSNTNGIIYLDGNNTYIRNGDASEYQARFIANGAVELYYDNVKKLETTSTGVTLVDNLVLDNATNAGRDIQWQPGSDRLAFFDNTKATFGDGVDLQIYHDGSHSYIDEAGTGGIKIRTAGEADVGFYKYTSNEKLAEFQPDNSCRLYYDNSKKFETTSTGITVTGSDTTGSIFKGDIRLKKTTDDDTQIKWDVSHTKMEFMDSVIAAFGAGNDLQIYHDGTHSRIVDHGSNATSFQTGELRIHDLAANEYIAKFVANGAVELYYDNTKKFETNADGTLTQGTIQVNGAEGATGQIRIHADEGDDNADKWRLVSNTDGTFGLQNMASGSYEDSIKATGDGNVELYFNNSKKFETTNSGITVTGNYATTGWIDIDSDSSRFRCGDGQDLEIWHDGSGSQINNSTGYLVIQSDDLRLRDKANGHPYLKAVADGAVELYYDGAKQIHTTSTGVTLADDKRIDFGTGADLRIYHESSSTTNWIEATNGDTRIQCTDGDIYLNPKAGEVGVKAITDGAVELYHNNNKKFETKSYGVKVGGDLWLDDSNTIKVGSSGDLQIYHNGSESFIADEGTGGITISSGTLSFKNQARDETHATMQVNGAVNLYYDNAKKFETTSAGVTITGSQSKLIGDVRFDNGTNTEKDIYWDESENRLNWFDSVKAAFGNSNDLQIYHNGSHSYIDETGTGNLYIRNGTDNSIWCGTDGAVNLYYDNSKKLETTTDGIKLFGNGYADFPDNGRIRMGADYDLAIYHSGSHGYILNGTGNFDIRTNNEFGIYNYAGDEFLAKFTPNGAVSLYYDHSKKLETTSAGVDITGSESRIIGDLRFDNSDHAGFDVFWDQSSKALEFADGVGAVFGNGDDLQIYHDGSNSFINNTTGEIRTNDTWRWDDSAKATFGYSNDLQIYHDGSNSYINNTTGILRIRDSEIRLCNTDNETYFTGAANGAAKLYYDDAVKLETTSTGINVTNQIYFNGDTDTHISNGGNTANWIRFTTGGNVVMDITDTHHVQIHDDHRLRFGASNDIQIFHNSGNDLNYFYCPQNNVVHEFAVGNSWTVQTTAADKRIYCPGSGTATSVELYHNGSKKFETTSTGINVTGGIRLGGNNAANECDDYEEGTFSLVMNPAGNSYSVSHMQAQYTKVGNVCHIQGWWRCSTANSVSGSLTVQGFPFAAYNNTGSGGLRQTLSAQVANANGNATDIVIQLNDNATTGTIKSTTDMSTGRYEWVATNIEDTTAVYINGSYLTT